MLVKKALLRFCLALVVTGLTASAARADELFVGTDAGPGLCCFNVNLHQVSSTDMQVTVSLTSGAVYFADTGSGNHPGFAFNLKDDPTISISGLSSPWVSGDVHYTSAITNGPDLGTFDYFIDNPGPGTSKHNDGPLVFDINDASGISFSSFIANGNGNYFAADIMDQTGVNTGESAINVAPAPVPEPSSLFLLGTGILSAAAVVRRRLSA